MDLTNRQEEMRTKWTAKKSKIISKRAKVRARSKKYKHKECWECHTSLVPFARNSRYCPACRGMSPGSRTWADEKERKHLSRLEKHNVSPRAFAAALKFQHGLCAICEKWGGENGSKLAIDHNHESTQFRGLLCTQCNAGIGMFRENAIFLDAAQTYLDRWRASPIQFWEDAALTLDKADVGLE
jgi:hypothetical protein